MIIVVIAITTLIFFAVLEKQGKPTKTARIRSRGRTPKILGKQAKNAQKGKDFLEEKKSKEIQNGKEKKIRELDNVINSIANDRDFVLQVPTRNRALSAEYLCDLTLTREIRCNGDLRLQKTRLTHVEF